MDSNATGGTQALRGSDLVGVSKIALRTDGIADME